MASKKKGCIVLKKGNFLKVTYSHRNSEPEGIGTKLVKWIQKDGPEAIAKYFDEVQVIREEDPMTPEQVESYKKYIPEQLWKDDLTCACVDQERGSSFEGPLSLPDRLFWIQWCLGQPLEIYRGS